MTKSTEDLNPNTEFAHTPVFWVYYAALIGFFIFCSYLVGIKDIWTVTNLVHSIVTFFLLHWVRGSGIGEDEFQTPGKYKKLTFWEQLDNEVAWSQPKKFFFIVPAALTYFAINSNSEYWKIFLNITSCAVAIVPKLPLLHRVRLFGINKD